MAGEPEMSRQRFSVAYNGETRKDNHAIDVEALAPALLAFGKLLREANSEFNGQKSTAKIVVASDFEHKCFQINFELMVTFYEQVKALLGSDPVKTAKEVLEWVGLLTPAGITGTGGISFLAYLKLKNGRKVVKATQTIDEDKSGIVNVQFEGDGINVAVHNHVYQLSNNPKALKATRDTFNPIGSDGFDTLELKEGNQVLDQISDADAQRILASCNGTLEELKEVEPHVDITTAWLSVYSPVYDLDSERWRFNLGREHVYVDISETSIAEDALNRGGALADDSYQVRLEIRTPIDKDGKKGKPSYKALEVLKFIGADPTMRQSELPIDQNSKPLKDQNDEK